MRNLISPVYLQDQNSNTDWKDKAMTTATGTYVSKEMVNHGHSGQTGLVVKTTAGSLVITFELSNDNNNWYEPYNSAGTKINTVANNLTGDAWVVFTPQVAEWIRFRFVLTGSNSTVSAIYHQQEEA